MDRDSWSSGIASEVDFWSRWLETRGLDWPDDFSFRADPTSELGGIAGQYLSDFTGVPKILDVGAGPMTALGKQLRGRPIELRAVDALAHLYDDLPFPEGLPILRTERCESERLSEKFYSDSFDLAYAQNTLDHSYDPILAIKQMIYVTKPGGLIITTHAANEAINENWQGFHQWNFHVANRDFKISNLVETFSVTEETRAETTIIELSPDGSPWVTCIMRKHQLSERHT